MKTFPRVLFVTPHAFNRVTGGGVTFGNLFRGWPKDSLACVHSDEVPTSDDVCELYYRLTEAELDISGPLSFARNMLRRGRPASKSMPVDGSSNEMPGASDGGRNSSLRRQLQRTLIGSLPPERARLTPALTEWIADFRPDLLFTLLGSNGMMELVEKIRNRFDLPVIPHIMDDWPSAAYRDGLVGPWQRWRMQHWLGHFFAVAEVRLGIGSAMCDAFGKRYGRPFIPFQNTVDVSRWSAVARKDLTVGKPARLLYVGSIFENAQLESLVDCAVAVRDLNRSGTPVNLSIMTPDFMVDAYRERLEIDASITIDSSRLGDGDFFAHLAAADVLLLPVNFDTESIRFIRYSMPTKVPAYLVSGTPILVYGPPEVAQVAYAIDREWGHVVSRRGLSPLRIGIQQLLEDSELRTHLSSAARRVAGAEHDASAVRTNFQKILRDASGVDAALAD